MRAYWVLAVMGLSGCFGIVRGLTCDRLGDVENCDTPEDDDCNGETNEVDAFNCVEFFADRDNDGFGAGAGVCQCAPDDSLVTDQGGDCDDQDPMVNPGAVDPCAESVIDADCNGVDSSAGVATSYLADGTRGPSYRALQRAIDATPDGGTVLVCPGTWAENLTVAQGVVVEGRDGREVTTLTVPEDGEGPVVAVGGAGAVTLRGLTITDASIFAYRGAAGVDTSEHRGSLLVEDVTFAELFNRSGAAGLDLDSTQGGTLRRVDFSDNVGSNGGGMAIWAGGPHLLEDVRFDGNLAGRDGSISSGGGLYINGGFDEMGSITLRDVVFADNDCYGGPAGMSVWSADVTAENVAFYRNGRAEGRFAVNVVGIREPTSLVCTDCDFGEGEDDNRGTDLYTFPADDSLWEYGDGVSIRCTSDETEGLCEAL